MPQNHAIPQGYMTVGQAAKRAGVTVRTLQYYDRQGLLSPTAQSEGGRRLYTDKDLVILHQILSMKSLGFSLSDIRQRLPALETPADVADALARQADSLRMEIARLTGSLTAIERLKAEVMQMQTVSFKKYADIIANLQMNNEYYYLIKRFDDDLLDHIRARFDRQSGLDFLDRFNRLNEEIAGLKERNAPPECDACQQAAKRYWDLVVEFTNGDMSLLPKLRELGNAEPASGAWEERQQMVNRFLEPALEIYFAKLGTDPFRGLEK